MSISRLALLTSLTVALVTGCGGGDGVTVPEEDGSTPDSGSGLDATIDSGKKDGTVDPDSGQPPSELDATLDIGFPDVFTVPDSSVVIEAGADGGCSPNGVSCTGAVANTCTNGTFSQTNCALQGKQCADGFGCVTCVPGTGSCSGSTGTLCKSDGSGYVQNLCDPLLGLSCNAGVCSGACANVGQSYIGCDYYAVTTSNPALNQSVFNASIAVANTGSATATLTVTGPSNFNQTYTVPAGAVQEVTIPWVPAISNTYATVRTNGAAYRVRSTQPVTVYQFNARDYQKSGTFSYTNDASLLLPVNAMTGNYWVAAMPDWNYGSQHYPGTITIVGTQDNTSVTFTASNPVQAGSGVSSTGSSSVTLNRGDVLEIMSALNAPANATYGLDISGSRVVASAPVEVFGGSTCSFVPANVGYCDHLEEVQFPEETLRTEYLVVPPKVSPGTPKHFIRLVGTQAGTTLTYDPPIGGAPTTLSAGQVGLFETGTAFKVTSNANHPIVVGLYMESEDNFAPGNPSAGDPAMSMAVGTAQFRSSYAFTAPNNYQVNWATIIAPNAGTVTIDGVAVGGWTAIGVSGYRFAYYSICNGNCGNFSSNHAAVGSLPFGIQVYGYGTYTSYMYPGGLDLKR